jgi:hypothetical protein
LTVLRGSYADGESWIRGGVEEGRLVVAPAAALWRYHPCEQKTLARGPVLRQSGRGLRPGGFMARLKPCPFEVLVGVKWVGEFAECVAFGVAGIRIPP